MYRQGILGFYKGNGWRLLHFFAYDVHRTWLQQYMDTEETILRRDSFFKDFLASLGASLYLHPLHAVEARYILNNRIPAFQSYKSFYSMLLQSGP